MRCGGFPGQVRNPVTDIFVIRRDEAALIAVEGMTYGEIGVAAVALFGEVSGI